MEDWIANNEKDYILKAISKASDLKKLFQIKKELRNIRKWINEEKHKAEVDKKKEQELIIGKPTCKECPED